MPDRQFVFAPFRLDPANQQLWLGHEPVALRPKLFAVLRRLLDDAGRLVTRDELRRAVWSTTAISESVLRGTIRELRDVLGDDATAARFIETVPHRGYRFIAPVTVTRASHAHPGSEPQRAQQVATGAMRPIVIGREHELGRLRECLDQAADGRRHVVFVTGEPGIGKTTLVDAFLAAAAELDGVSTARGQCVEHYGPSEAYLPVLDALTQLCSRPDGAQTIGTLARYAPTWLMQMPGVVDDAQIEILQRRVHGASRERMLRELADALDALTSATTVVLVLEDLHWSDHSTLDLISLLAQRRTPARLLLLGTYRPADVIVSGHALRAIKQELSLHHQCEELPLPFLTDHDVSAYLAARFPGQSLPVELGQALHRSTEGSPLFVVNVVDYWLTHRLLVERAGQWQMAGRLDELAAGVPESLRHMIEKQLAALSPAERGTLEVASVAGLEFSAAAVAAVLDEGAEQVEERCEELARQARFLRARGVDLIADGATTGRYQFIHGLYQQVLYDGCAAARRARMHRRLGEWGAAAYSARARAPAAELAMHFERARDYARAVEHLTHAAAQAMDRQAPHEAAVLLDRGVMLLQQLPESAGRDQQELALRVALGVPLLMTQGYAAADVERTYARARALCGRIGQSPQLLPALAGLFRFSFVRAEFQTALAIGEQIRRLGEQTGDRTVALVAHSLLGPPLVSLGELAAAREHLDNAIALYDPREHRVMASLYGDDPGVTSHCIGGLCLWLLGYPDQALRAVQQALDIAMETGSPYCETFALDFAIWVHVLRREERVAQTFAERVMQIAPEQGFQFLLADSQVLHAWIVTAQGTDATGVEQVHAAISAYDATGAVMSRPAHRLLSAMVSGALGRADEALDALRDARAAMEATGERAYEAETHRLHGELILSRSRASGRARRVARDAAADAEACFRRAIAVAQRQRARSLELRAATSLSRLRQQQGKREQARAVLADTYAWFTEGFDTADLRDARQVLAELG